ncbi:MAG: hypothetical protein AB7O26_10650 [Planctomycetaceae bacterium]
MTANATMSAVEPKASSRRLYRLIIISIVVLLFATVALFAWRGLEQHRVVEQFKAAGCFLTVAPMGPDLVSLGLDEKGVLWEAISTIENVRFTSDTLPIALAHPAPFQQLNVAAFYQIQLDDDVLSRLFDSNSLGDAGSARRANGILSNTRRLGFDEVGLNDDRMRCFSAMKNLEGFALLGGDVTDAGLAHLAGLPRLQTLSVRRVRLDGSALSKFSASTPLTVVDFELTEFGDSALAELAKFSTLRDIRLRKTRVTDAGLTPLLKLPRLRRIDLDGTAVTDAGLDHLAKLGRIEEIDLSDTSITDAGIMKLAHHTELRNLKAYQTKITEAGVEAFHHYRRLRGMSCTLEW